MMTFTLFFSRLQLLTASRAIIYNSVCSELSSIYAKRNRELVVCELLYTYVKAVITVVLVLAHI